MAYDNPHGFTLVGASDDVKTLPLVVVSGTTVFSGDVVSEGATSGTIKRAAAGDTVIGVCLDYIVGDGTKVAKIVVDPNAIFRVQVENGGSQLAATDVFSGFDIIAPAAPATGRISNMELNDVAEVAGGQFILLGRVIRTEPYASLTTYTPAYGSNFVEAKVKFNLAELIWFQD